MKSMEPQMGNSREMSPQSFFEQIQIKAKGILSEIGKNLSELKEGALEMPEQMKGIREGNFPDQLRAGLHAKTLAAKQTFEELPKGVELSKEDFHNRQGLAKLVEFYELQEQYFARLAETRDDPDSTELALIMWSELQETYAKCMKEFSGNNQTE